MSGLRKCCYASGVLAATALVLLLAFTQMAVGATPLGITKFEVQTTLTEATFEEGGLHFNNVPYEFTQAGGHPYAITSKIELAAEKQGEGEFPTRNAKDLVGDLPPGLLGNPQAVPRCPLVQALQAECPGATQVGYVVVHVFGNQELSGPIVNVVPEAGQSAEFALETNLFTYVVTGHVVRIGSTYGLTLASNEIPASSNIRAAELTFWGVPADVSHGAQRGLFCATVGGETTCRGGFTTDDGPQVPFLTMPTDCSDGPEVATLRADSWQEPGSVSEGEYRGYTKAEAPFPQVTGCNLLQFEPSIEAKPDTLLADEPVGLGVNVQVPQNESIGAPATPEVRDSVVTLPQGLSISPGIVDGIQACDESGPEGINFSGPLSEEVGANGELRLAPGRCPNASTVGEAEAETPLLPSPVKGHLYLARPLCGGADEPACTEQDALDGRLYQIYLELGGTGALANAGVNLKFHGITKVDPATGQLTAVFENTPQLPFSELRVRLNGGPRAPLDTPAACGTATTTADFTPWSAPGSFEGVFMAGTPDATPSSHFQVGGCASPTPFAPSFVGGTVTPQAGQFSSFTMNLLRQDRQQFVKGIQLHTPPGLLGMLSSVPLCGEPQADLGTCPEASKIGTTRVASGAGSHPFEIEGNVYLTDSYGGAPFGLSIVVHVVAGPFNLGVKVVRARIAVDRSNSTITVATDETGPYAIPQIVFGVPVRLKRVTVNIDRPGFMFNPTSCTAKQITAKISGSEGAVATVSSPFAVGGCKSLAFKPKFAVSTAAHTSRVKGASLDAKVSYPAGSLGNAANIASVKVSLPRQLPSRLSTLQKACPAKVFEANAAACPKGSIVGIARTRTPLLPVELSGPAYFVSHGGEAFPSLVVVLEGDGVRVDLTGTTFINKANITSSTFKTVPDVPVNSFELYLPQGRDSALAANGNLCTNAKKLVMPTTFTAQNGARFTQRTKIAVEGCKQVKKKKGRGARSQAARMHKLPARSGTNGRGTR